MSVIWIECEGCKEMNCFVDWMDDMICDKCLEKAIESRFKSNDTFITQLNKSGLMYHGYINKFTGISDTHRFFIGTEDFEVRHNLLNDSYIVKHDSRTIKVYKRITSTIKYLKMIAKYPSN
jgi:hypothetical protein